MERKTPPRLPSLTTYRGRVHPLSEADTYEGLRKLTAARSRARRARPEALSVLGWLIVELLIVVAVVLLALR